MRRNIRKLELLGLAAVFGTHVHIHGQTNYGTPYIYIYMCVYNKLDPYLVVWHICVFVGEGSEMPTEPKVWVLGKWGFNTDRVKVSKDQVHYETWGLPKSRGCPNSWMVYNGKSENYMDDKWGTFFFETSIWLLVRCGRRSSISTSEQFKTWLCLK